MKPKIKKAMEWAERLHEGQTRKGTKVPYTEHLFDVAGLVTQVGGSEDQIVAALLHDSLEDQGDRVTYGDIEREFGFTAAMIVKQLTKDATIPDWDARLDDYLWRLNKIAPEARTVAVADKLCNLRDIIRDYALYGDDLWTRFNGGFKTPITYEKYAVIFDNWNDRTLEAGFLAVKFGSTLSMLHELMLKNRRGK